ncbi:MULTISPECIES: tetratricopeptide repeat protein [Aerosakkonema]|uniref:tetratricopeptide repeat protein n=1 Tax=Aerosakkonema TaxID=1246629 RepID=UPI0035B89E21
MEFEEALKVLDAAVFAKKKVHVRDVEVVILKGSWQGQKYHEIAAASGYTETYLKQDIGPKLWKLVSEALGEKVSKTNFQAALERRWRDSLGEAKKDRKDQSLEGVAGVTPEAKGQKPADAGNFSGSEQEETINNNKVIFIGREKAIADLNSLVRQGAKIILIQGEGGIGKSLLSWEYLTSAGFDLIMETWMAKEMQQITNAKSVVEEWLKRHFNEEPSVDFGVTLERLRQKLRNPSQRVGVIIDNLEPALDKDGKFIPAHRDYVELLRVLADRGGNCVTLITSRERLGESAVSFHDYRLQGLDIAAWQVFFSSRNINTESSVLKEMHQAYGGNAKAMHIISGAIQADWEGDIEAYWHQNGQNLLIERDLKDLISSQFDRLQEHDPEAYKLLCRMGCYRYQEVRSVLLDGVLHLLWDIPESQRRRVIQSLRERSLLDFYKGEHYLHSVTRAEARIRLKATEDWKIVNRKAADFWTTGVTVIDTTDDAIKALEAYYHYIDIEEFDRAADVIVLQRKLKQSDLGVAETLSNSCGRVGLFQHMISVITFLIKNITNEYSLTHLYNELGNILMRAGDIQKAIEAHEKAIEMAKRSQELILQKENSEKLKFELENINISILFTISSSKLALGEIEEGIKSYEEIVTVAENTNLHLYAVGAWLAIAVLYSQLNPEEFKEKAISYEEKAKKGYDELPKSHLSVWLKAYSSVGFGMIGSNLGNYEKALEMYREALSYAEESNYIQVKGQALNGVGVVYRKQQNFESALVNHTNAIEIFSKIGAKSSIADAYYERGLTYQNMGAIDKSKTDFLEAIQFYEKIGAPKQVAKVKKAMSENQK